MLCEHVDQPKLGKGLICHVPVTVLCKGSACILCPIRRHLMNTPPDDDDDDDDDGVESFRLFTETVRAVPDPCLTYRKWD